MKYHVSSVVLSMILFAALPVFASGDRSVIVTAEKADQYRVLTIAQFKEFQGRLRYIGSTETNHAFLISRTSFAGGRPFSTIFRYRVPVKELLFKDAWSLGERAFRVIPYYCPRALLRATSKPSFIIMPHGKTRKSCLRWEQKKQ